MSTKNVHATKYTYETQESVNDTLTVELPLQISLNDTPYTTTLRTPGNDLFLVRGLLYAEEIFLGPSERFHYYTTSENGLDCFFVRLETSSTPKRAQLLSVSSCGLCGVESFQYPTSSPVSVDTCFTFSDITLAYSKFIEHQHLFRLSGGTHACGLFSSSLECLTVQEDIGRHNATDKAIGDLLEKGDLNTADLMFTSGRISYEIVHKCYRAHIPVLIAVSSPSTLAVEMATQLGITLIGFFRENRFTCYSHPERLRHVHSS